MTSPSDGLIGDQVPRVCSVPQAVTSAGREAIDLAASAGLVLDPWQCLVLDQSLGERADGKWSAFEVGLIVPRQCGKGSVLEARELAGLFLFDEKLIIHSAHLFDTSLEHFRRILQLIESAPDLDRLVHRVSRSHGEEGIELRTGQRLRFRTRTRGGGRGFSGDLIVLDEAYNLPEAAVAALMPTLAAKSMHGNPQIWYASSAADQEIHDHCHVLARVRRRGLAGDDPSLAYFEWSAPDDVWDGKNPGRATSDRRLWAMANPGLGLRITEEYIEREHRSMSPRTFATERLSIGDWPVADVGESGPIKRSAWSAIVDTGSEAGGEVAFGAEVSVDRAWSSIGCYSVRPDGVGHLELIDRRAGTAWVVPRLLELRKRWNPVAVAIDAKGPAVSLVLDAEAAGLTRPADPERPARGDLMVLSLSDMATACAQLVDAINQRTVRHRAQPELDEAVFGCATRAVGDVAVWGRRSASADISPLSAVTVARHAYVSRLEAINRPRPKPLAAWA